MTEPVSPPALQMVLDRIRGWAAANAWKPTTLARMAGLSERVTRDMDRADWSPSSTSIRRLESLIPEGWQVGDPLPNASPDRPAAPPGADPARLGDAA